MGRLARRGTSRVRSEVQLGNEEKHGGQEGEAEYGDVVGCGLTSGKIILRIVNSSKFQNNSRVLV